MMIGEHMDFSQSFFCPGSESLFQDSLCGFLFAKFCKNYKLCKTHSKSDFIKIVMYIKKGTPEQ